MRQRVSYKALVNKYMPNMFSVESNFRLRGEIPQSDTVTKVFYFGNGYNEVVNEIKASYSNSSYDAWKWIFHTYVEPISTKKVKDCQAELIQFIKKQSKSTHGDLFPTSARILFQESYFEKNELVRALDVNAMMSCYYQNKSKNTMVYNLFIQHNIDGVREILERYK